VKAGSNYSKVNRTEADPDISIRGAVFLKKKNRISKQFVLRKIKRYRAVIQSED
jgi:hypothetical protein